MSFERNRFLFREEGSSSSNVVVGEVPVGTFGWWFGPEANIPSNWIKLDGTTFSAELYPALYLALGTTTLPNLMGRSVRGDTTPGTVYPELRIAGTSLTEYMADDTGYDDAHDSSTEVNEESMTAIPIIKARKESTYEIIDYDDGVYETGYLSPDYSNARSIMNLPWTATSDGTVYISYTMDASAVSLIPTVNGSRVLAACENTNGAYCLSFTVKKDDVINYVTVGSGTVPPVVFYDINDLTGDWITLGGGSTQDKIMLLVRFVPTGLSMNPYKYKSVVLDGTTAHFYVDSNGSDETGDGSIDHPYYTVNRVMEHIKLWKITRTGVVTIHCSGTFQYNESQVISHSDYFQLNLDCKNASFDCSSFEGHAFQFVSQVYFVVIGGTYTRSSASSTASSALVFHGVIGTIKGIVNITNFSRGISVANNGVLNIPLSDITTRITVSSASYGITINPAGFLNITSGSFVFNTVLNCIDSYGGSVRIAKETGASKISFSMSSSTTSILFVANIGGFLYCNSADCTFPTFTTTIKQQVTNNAGTIVIS